MSVDIISTGSYKAGRVLTNDDLSKLVETSNEWITERTGIKTRYISDDMTTEELAIAACKNALNSLDIDVNDIDMLIFSSVSSDTLTPASSYSVAGRLGIKNAICMDINAACSGFIYGVSTANALLKELNKKYAIVVGAERLSKFVDWSDRSTCILFGDGAGCAILENTDIAESTSSKVRLEILDTKLGGKYDSKGYLTISSKLNIDDETSPYIKMNGRQVYKFATDVGPRVIEKLIEDNQINKDDISMVVPHQANVRIIETMSSKSLIPIEKWYTNIQHYGNTSSASVPIALNEALRKLFNNNTYKNFIGKYLLSVGFGGGLSYGGILMKFK